MPGKPVSFNKKLKVDLEEVQGLFPQFEKVNWRTKYYLIERYKMLSEVTAQNGWVMIECRACRGKEELQLHHINGSGFNGDYVSFKHHKKMREHVKKGEPFLVLCKKCHLGWHGSASREGVDCGKIEMLSSRILKRKEMMRNERNERDIGRGR